ncbi:MAG: DUF1616 domain-containing protein [Candidatus Bathyarchaeota archaeon]|nr:DUF1616 domain-containing protein [Candidatus Bathyarchaeota archaeon]
MKTRLCITLAIVTFTLVLLNPCIRLDGYSSPTTQTSEEIEEARARLQEAYNITVEAERTGAEVSEALKNLNNALDYIIQAESLAAQGNTEQTTFLTNASIQFSEETFVLIRDLRQQAEALRYTNLIAYVAASVALVALGLFAFFMGWRMWKGYQRKKFIRMRIKAPANSKPSSNKLKDEEKASEEKTVIVAVLAAIIVLASLLVYTSLSPAPQESFASLYLLDSEKMAEKYPRLLILGENNTLILWVGVENFMNRIEYASILVKVDNGSGLVDPSPVEPVERFEKILLDKETWEFPLISTMNQSGEHRMILELWLFNELEEVFSYTGSWCTVRVDVIES